MREQAKTGLESGIEAEVEAGCWSSVCDWGLAGAFIAVVDVLSDIYDTFVLAQIFKVDEATICRAIKRIASLAERILKVKHDPTLSENDLQLLIIDATEQRIERPKNQRDYCSGKAHVTIKTEVVIEPKGRILRVSKPYEGRVHDFEIRQSEGPLPAVPILANSGYQGLQNEHLAAVILPKKKSKNSSLSTSEQARNTKLARC